MKFALRELFKIAADPFQNHTAASSTFVAPAKATARVVGVIQPSFIQKWFTLRVIDPNKNPLASAAQAFVTEKLIDMVIPFLARGLWKVVTLLPGKVKFAVSGTLTVVTAINYVLRTVIPTGLLSTLTEFPQTVRATMESAQQTVGNSAIITNTVKELAGTVKMYTSTGTTTPDVSVPAKSEAISSTVLPSMVEAAQKTTEIAAGHGWLYYVGWCTVLVFSIGGSIYIYKWFTAETPFLDPKLFTFDSKTGLIKPTEAVRNMDLSSLPEPDPTWLEQSGISHLLTYFLTGTVPVGGFTIYMFLPGFLKKKPIDFEPESDVEVGELRDMRKVSPKRGIVERPSEMANASPTEKAQFIKEQKSKVEELVIPTPSQPEPQPKLHEIPSVEELPPQLKTMNDLIENLSQEELMTVITSPKFQAWQTEPEQFAYAFEQILVSPDRMAAIMQIFGGA